MTQPAIVLGDVERLQDITIQPKDMVDRHRPKLKALYESLSALHEDMTNNRLDPDGGGLGEYLTHKIRDKFIAKGFMAHSKIDFDPTSGKTTGVVYARQPVGDDVFEHLDIVRLPLEDEFYDPDFADFLNNFESELGWSGDDVLSSSFILKVAGMLDSIERQEEGLNVMVMDLVTARLLWSIGQLTNGDDLDLNTMSQVGRDELLERLTAQNLLKGLEIHRSLLTQGLRFTTEYDSITVSLKGKIGSTRWTKGNVRTSASGLYTSLPIPQIVMGSAAGMQLDDIIETHMTKGLGLTIRSAREEFKQVVFDTDQNETQNLVVLVQSASE